MEVREMNILLGLTGSVASTLAPKIVKGLQELGEVQVIATDYALRFFNREDIKAELYTDKDEWKWPDGLPYRDEGWHTPRGWHDAEGYRNYYEKDDEIIHIALRRGANALVIAPTTANTLAKIMNGLCDNLLTSVVKAWDWNRPIILAPAMNTLMWKNPITQKQIADFQSMVANTVVVPPISKDLACGDTGEGAMARIETVVDFTREALRWGFPLEVCNGIPIAPHPGAFGHKRKHSHHTGIDLYCEEGEPVNAVEDGEIVGIEWFTGPKDESPWWNDTQAILIEGATGVVCYGEIEVSPFCQVGGTVSKGGRIGHVKPVLKEGKERPDIPGHSRSMLHIELYTHGSTKCSVSWKLDQEKVKNMRDPTTFLRQARNAPDNILTME
jgi:phosphopantothenoylcysteine decarboxylase